MDLHALESLRKAFDATAPRDTSEAQRVQFDDQVTLDQSVDSDTVTSPVTDGPLGLLELILKDPMRLDRLIRQPDRQRELLPWFVAISLIGFVLFGVAMSLVLSAAAVWPQLFAIDLVLSGTHRSFFEFKTFPTDSFASPWLNGQAFRLMAAYSIGLIAATGICLPSLYFYGLLAGIRMTMLDVVIHALKSTAVAAVTLVGILPIYAALGLAIAIFPLPEFSRDGVLMIGLGLPFIAGVSGTWSLYRGLSMLTDTMAANRRSHRECFLQRLVMSWAMVYSAVSPVLIFTLWQRLQG